MANNGMIDYACTNSDKIAPFFYCHIQTAHFQQSCRNPPPRLEECKSWWVQGVAAKKKTSYF